MKSLKRLKIQLENFNRFSHFMVVLALLQRTLYIYLEKPHLRNQQR